THRPPAHPPHTRPPPQFAARAGELLGGTVSPVTPRDAATVMLLRPAPARHAEAVGAVAPPGLQVYMLRRRSSMAFAAGAYVFPRRSLGAPGGHARHPWGGPGPPQQGRPPGGPARP